MSRIEKMFRGLRDGNERGLFPFVVAGYPSLEVSEAVICEVVRAGADLVEIGVPFSDPIADGPIIQHASQIALDGGLNLDDIFDMVRRLRKKIDIPLVLMSYYNPLLQFGLEGVVNKANEVGLDGFIVPDLPPCVDINLKSFLNNNNMDQIFLAAVNTSRHRLKLITENTSGFLYLISRLGVTGPCELSLDPIRKKIDFIKELGDIPIAVGFGISKPSQVKAIAEIADAVIVGSSLVKMIPENKKSLDKDLKKIFEFIQSIKKEC